MLPLGDATTLSQLYHLNSEPWLNADAYGQAANYEVEYREAPADSDGRVPLMPAADSALVQLLRTRASCRDYAQHPLAAELLGHLLGGTYGIARVDFTTFEGDALPLRTVPSAGGLFPLELYLVTQRVTGVADGLHHYNVRDHALERVNGLTTLAALEPALLMYPCIRDVNAVIFIAAVFHRSQKKYGPRGYRYILLEAGHAAQNLCLLAAEQGLGSLCMGGYVDSALNRALGLETPDEGVVYSVAVGWPSQQAV